MARQIVHMDLDSFFVSVERKLDPSLAGKPVIVGGSSDRGVVASCSYEARKFGVRSAMPSRQAKQLCPDAIFVKGNHPEYSKASSEVTEIIRNSVPVFEKTSIDEFYIDLSGTERFFGSYKLATELRQRIIKETGLPISFALATSKTVAKIGTGQAKPNGQIEIPAGTEKEFLAPLPVRRIPMVGEKMQMQLLNAGIEYIRDIQMAKPERLAQLLGDYGMVLWNKAHGIDASEVEPYSERKSISTECTFSEDTCDLAHLHRVIVSMAEKICFQLREEEKLCACVTMKMRYSDFSTFTMQCKIPYTALDKTIIATAKQLFHKLYRNGSAVRLIGVRLSHLIQGSQQFSLFEDTGEQVQLMQAMDLLKNKFGDSAVMRASGLGLDKRDTNYFGKE